MLYFEAWKRWLIIAICLIGVLNLVPNFYYQDVIRATDARKEIAHYTAGGREPPAELTAQAESWPGWLPSGVVNLGLDLQGGSYFLLEVKVEQVFRDRMETLRSAVGGELREAGVRRYRGLRVVGDDTVEVSITNAEDVETAAEALRGMAQPVGGGILGAGQPDITVELVGDQTYRMTLTDAAKEQIATTTMNAAIEVVRTRVDALGTREPTIQRQGDNRILLQLPGASNVDVDALTKVAKLEFQMVADQIGQFGDLTAEQAAGMVAPRGVEILEFDPELNPDRGDLRLAVYEKVDITGEHLAEASQGFDRNGVIGVNIRFDAAGARVFGDITRENVGRRFAMVLDGKVLSAPSIRTPIADGNAIITGSFSIPSANALAVNLRSGNLPTEMTVEESSVVGPELGADSIEAGKLACIVGFAAVLVYMAVAYGFFGLLANTALLVNVVLIFGALSLFGATLTLPGIAGVVLTIGMAVDANVLVFERIREELKSGRNVARAIETGYARALSAIIDANVTTFIAAAILFGVGSGPVRGFAVTLGIGIVTSVFTAVMITRFLVAIWFGWKRPKTLAL